MPNVPDRAEETAQELTLQLFVKSLIDYLRNDRIRTWSKIEQTQEIQIPGIGLASAYASGDAFGLSFELIVPEYGTIANVIFYDLDDEGIQKDIVIFSKSFTETADNAAFDVSDADLRSCIGVINIVSFNNFNSNQIGVSTPALSYHAPEEKLYCQVVTRGADNIAAGSIPRIALVIL